MNIFDVLSLIGGLALFLFGMNIMGDALEKRAGNQLKNILEKLTSNRFKGFLLGAGEKLKTCRYRNDSFRICSFNVWNGTDVRFC